MAIPSALRDVLDAIGSSLNSMSAAALKLADSVENMSALSRFQKTSQAALNASTGGQVADALRAGFQALSNALNPKASASATNPGAATTPEGILNVSILKLNVTIEHLIARLNRTAIPLPQGQVTPPKGTPVADDSWTAMFKNIGTALSAFAKSAEVAIKATARVSAEMLAIGVATAYTIDKLAGLPLQALQRSIASVGSEIANFVRLAQPGVFQRFTLAINDLTASIGIALVPLLEKLTQVFRVIGSAIYSLSANGQLALRVLAAISVSFVTLGVVLAGIATVAVVGTIALKGFAAAIALVQAILSGGALVPVMIAIGAGMEFVGTAGAALGGVLAALGSVAVTVTAVMEDLTPVLNVLAGAFMTFMNDLGSAFKSLTQGGLLAALASMFAGAAQSIGGFIKQLAPAFAVLVSAGTKLIPVFSTIVSVLGQISAAPFLVLGKIIVATGAYLEAFASAFGTIFSEVGNVLMDLLKVFGELVVEMLVFNPVAMTALGALKELGIVMAGFALAVADMVKAVVGWVRLLFNIDTPIAPNQPAKPPDNTGAAATNATTGDPRDALRKARESAFQMGTGAAKPDEQTAKNTGEIAKAIQETRATITTFITQFPAQVESLAGKVVDGVVSGVVTGFQDAIKLIDPLGITKPSSGGGSSGGVPSAGDIIADTIKNQLRRLNPF
jgi:hypothetical protein